MLTNADLDLIVFSVLQENEQLTKVEMFHCAACKVYTSTSVAEVQTHITSEEHISCVKVTLLSCSITAQMCFS